VLSDKLEKIEGKSKKLYARKAVSSSKSKTPKKKKKKAVLTDELFDKIDGERKSKKKSDDKSIISRSSRKSMTSKTSKKSRKGLK
jgi:hypothetical protein